MFHVITGGSGSGKSEYAENCIVHYHEKMKEKQVLVYIATMEPFGEETQRKIARHRSMREGKGFQTVECYRDLVGIDGKVLEGGSVLLECMSNLAANTFYERVMQEKEPLEQLAKETVEVLWKGIRHLQNLCSNLVVVTNEVGGTCEPLSKEMEQYTKIMGEINRKMAEHADLVTEVVYGIPVEVK